MQKVDFEKHLKSYFDDIDTHELGEIVSHPTAVGWKVASSDFFSTLRSIMDIWDVDVEQAHIGAVDNRFIASIVFSEGFDRGLQVIKLMQPRPGSQDRIGIVDHVDFYVEDISVVHQSVLTAGHEVELQENDAHKWLSVRFNGQHFPREMKFVDHTVLNIGAKSLARAEKTILSEL